jgi:superfamily II DNA or RNA helicase
MESVDGSVIVASYGTFATGIDLKNVHHIIFAESTKAEITIRQAIGRGMRYLKGKEEVIIWDIIDDLSGYSVRHGSERMKIYKEQKFKILPETRINLSSIN